MTIANINGVDIHYETSGEGPPFIWLHGLMGSIERSRKFGEGMDGVVQRGFHVIAYDARGHGESGDSEDASDSAYSRDAHASDMLGLLDHLNVERAIIGGGSMGASVSIAFALANPQRAEKLVLVSPPPLADTIGPAQQIFGGLATLIEQFGLEPAVDIVMQLPMYKEMLENDPAQYELMRAWFLSQHPSAVVFAIRGILFGPQLPEERFAEITCRTLIVAQPDDQIHPLATAEKLHTAITGSRLVVAPSMGYYREHQDELTDAVASFLSDSASVK